MSIHATCNRAQPTSWIQLTGYIALCMLLSTVSGDALQASNQNYAWSLESGLFSVEPQETVAVLVTELAASVFGTDVIVRFFDPQSILLNEVEQLIFPGEPLIAEYVNGGQGIQPRVAMRVEVVLQSSDSEVKPITTVEVHRADNSAVVQNWSCAGPVAREPVETEPSCCPGFIATDLNP